MTGTHKTSRFRIWFILVLGAVAAIPLLTSSEYYIRFAAMLLLWIGMAGCWNIMCGYTGYIDFGPVVYFGIGSYGTAISMTALGIGFFPAVAFGGVIAGLVALPVLLIIDVLDIGSVEIIGQ